MRRLDKARVLEMCVSLARTEGIRNPLDCLVRARDIVGDSGVDHAGALSAALHAAGGSLVKWWGLSGNGHTLDDTVALFEEALFSAQLEG